jgi:hypothetical protein
MARVLWKRLNPTDFNAMSGSAALSPTGGGARHIVLGTSKAGNRVETFLPPLKNHQVTIQTQAGPRWPKASLTFTSNPGRRNGEWLISDQKNNRHPAWTAVAGFPTTLDPANPPVVLVLKVDDEYHVDWRPQRSLSSIAPLIASSDRGVADAPSALLSELLFRPQLSPVDAQVVGEQLQLVDTTSIEAASSEGIVDSVRELHLRTAERLAAYLAGSNVGPGFSQRFDAVHELLSETLTSERALQLAIQVRGLEGMMGAVAERLDDVTVADIAIFASDLIDLLNQLPAYRLFVDEARAAVAEPDESVDAAATVITALEDQPDETVEPRLKRAMHNVRLVAEDIRDRLTTLALVRTVENVLRAVGRFLNERVVTFGREATKAFDATAGKTFGDNIGKSFGTAMANLVKTSSVLAAIWALNELFPGNFAFAGHLIRMVKSLLF